MILEALLMSALTATPADRVIGWTSSGAVVGKGHEPAHTTIRTVGKQAHRVEVPECWRLDLIQWRAIHGGVCVDKGSWDRAHIGDRVRSGRLQ